jgi:hypothetical protein
MALLQPFDGVKILFRLAHLGYDARRSHLLRPNPHQIQATIFLAHSVNLQIGLLVCEPE